MSSQQPAFYFGGQAQNQYVQAPPPASDGPIAARSQPQQMAFQQNAALPGIDLSALNGISAEQLMAIARLMQSGQITLPPPAPVADSTPSALPVSAPLPRPAATQDVSAPIAIGGNNADMDREEGELADDPESSRAHALKSMARSSSLTERGAQSQNDARDSSRKARSSNVTQPSGAVAPRGNFVLDPATGAALPSMAVKAFVLELHKVGYGFDDLAREVGNTQALRNLYKQIGLPLRPISSAHSAAGQQSIAQRDTVHGAPTVDKTPLKAVAERQTPGKPVAASFKTPAPVNAKPDRASYLAKLQAAKNKKSEPAAESPKSIPTQSLAVSAAATTHAYPPAVNTETPPFAGRQALSASQAAAAAAPQSDASTAVASPRSTGAARPTKVTVDTELVRQRLAKLQAERAAAQKAHTGNNQQLRLPSNNPVQPSQNAALPTATSTRAFPSPVTVDRDSLSAAALPSLARGSGLPGLFTTRSLVQQSSSPAPPPKEESAAIPMGIPTQSRAQSPASLNLPPQRSGNGERALWNGSSASSRVFGESRLQNEAFIIETSSDDDDDGEDMAIDDSPGQKSSEPETKSVPARPVGLLVDLAPSRFDTQRSALTPGTSGVDLKRKLEEIEVAKQQLEEMKRRKVVIKPASTQSPMVALTARSSTSLSDNVSPNAELGNQSSTAAATISKQQQKEALRKRLKELQNSLPQKSTSGASGAALPTSEISKQLALEHPEDQSSGAADVEDDDDGDLYEPDPVNDVETSLPAAGVQSDDLEDDAGEIYDPQRLDSTVNAEMETQLSSDNSKIGSRATTHSGAADGEASNTQLNEPAPPAQQGSNTNETVQDLRQGCIDLEEGEFVDDDSDNMYEPSMNAGPITAHPPQASAVSNSAAPADVLDEVRGEDDDEDDGNQPMDISEESDSDSDSNSDSSDESSDDYEPEQDIIPEPIVLPGLSDPVEDPGNEDPNQPQHSSKADNLAPELQPAVEQGVTSAEPGPTGSYKPYTSMLSGFKEFRYHPSFLDTVPGGHKSLTYSNRIDPDKPICPFEIGGRCNDKDCQFQHFNTMTLSDNDLLREIGTRKIPVKDTEEEKMWRDGLTAVVQELRSTNRGKDVAAIAQRIAEYRREFRGDPTKTLLLD